MDSGLLASLGPGMTKEEWRVLKQLQFDEEVVVVTGAGAGIGRWGDFVPDHRPHCA